MINNYRVVLGYLSKSSSGEVYRIDTQRIVDFSKGLQKYWHTDDWTTSGLWSESEKYESGGTDSGLYAVSDIKMCAAYSVPRDVKWVHVGKCLYFNRKDAARIKGHSSWLSVFDGSRFRKLPSGEWFSENPGVPLRQEQITNPLEFIKRAGLSVSFVDNLESFYKEHRDDSDFVGAEGFW